MKQAILAAMILSVAVPARAQFGSVLDKGLKKAQQVKDAKDKLDDLNVSEEEERKIGDDVSAKIRERFGVVQNAAVHKYVTLVGMNLAKQSERPALNWTFIVLDTDGVNAFASPGGIVHITRGALGLMASEAELAGVLAHEIGHVTHKHTVNAIKKNKAVQLGTNETLSDRGPFLDKIANKAYEMVLENKFDRGDEMDSDKVSVTLTEKAGYAPGTLAVFLAKLDERNKDQPAQNGLFASHPETRDRIDTIRKLAGARPGAWVEARFKENIKYTPTAVTAIATVEDGAAGLTGSTKDTKDPKDKETKDTKKDETKKEEPKKGFGLGALKPASSSERQTAQVSASGGSRGVGPDRAAKGGGNPAIVKVSVSDAEIAAFKKGIA
jgi:predicted Zn-dependent protease